MPKSLLQALQASLDASAARMKPAPNSLSQADIRAGYRPLTMVILRELCGPNEIPLRSPVTPKSIDEPSARRKAD